MLDSGRWDHTRQRSIHYQQSKTKRWAHTKHLSKGPGGAFPKLPHCPHDASFCSMSTSELEKRSCTSIELENRCFLAHDLLNHLSSGKPQRKPRKFTDQGRNLWRGSRQDWAKLQVFLLFIVLRLRNTSPGDFSDKSQTSCGNYLTVLIQKGKF